MKAENACGSCTLCCKVMGISELPEHKPVNTWCSHCDKGKGCTIYGQHPNECREFQCAWLESQGTDFAMPLELRPDHSKVVLYMSPQGASQRVMCGRVDPGFPMAWKQEPLASFVRKIMANDMRFLFMADQTRGFLVHRYGVRECIMSPPDKNNVQNIIGYRD